MNPKIKKSNVTVVNRMYVEDLPLKGQLGYSVRFNDAAQLVIDKIDETRLGYSAGLREGDIIRRINGKLVRNQKVMVEYILEGFEQSGAIVEVSRGANIIELLLQPPMTEFFPGMSDDNDEIYPQPDEDSL